MGSFMTLEISTGHNYAVNEGYVITRTSRHTSWHYLGSFMTYEFRQDICSNAGVHYHHTIDITWQYLGSLSWHPHVLVNFDSDVIIRTPCTAISLSRVDVTGALLWHSHVGKFLQDLCSNGSLHYRYHLSWHYLGSFITFADFNGDLHYHHNAHQSLELALPGTFPRW